MVVTNSGKSLRWELMRVLEAHPDGVDDMTLEKEICRRLKIAGVCVEFVIACLKYERVVRLLDDRLVLTGREPTPEDAVITLLAEDGPKHAHSIDTWTGYTESQVKRTLDKLERARKIKHTPTGKWTLTPRTRRELRAAAPQSLDEQLREMVAEPLTF